MVLILFGIIAVAAFSILLKIKTKDWFNPGTIFLVYWAFISVMASLKLFNLRETSLLVYEFILIGMIGYYLGSAFGIKIRIGRKDVSDAYSINYVFYDFACVSVIVYSLFRIARIVNYIAQGYSWWTLRLMVSNSIEGRETLITGTLDDLIYSFFISPWIYLIAPTMAAEMFVGKRNKNSIILGIISVAVYSIATISRAIWVFLILYLIFIFFLYREKYELPNKVKKAFKYLPVMVVVSAVVVWRITLIRNSETVFWVNAYAYIAGALPLFSIHLEEAISYTRTYGMLTFAGFLRPVLFLLNWFHIMPYPAEYWHAQAVKNNLETFIPISPQITMNAYATLFYDFYIDFGVMGIILFSFLFGYLCMRAYQVFRRRLDMRSLVIYLILLQYILFSVARIYTVLDNRALVFIWIFLMFKKEGKKNSVSFAHDKKFINKQDQYQN